MVVCYSILNSVDTVQTERDVMLVLNALCRVGGCVHVSGRRRKRLAAMTANTKQSNAKQYFEADCLDADGFLALYRGDLEGSASAWTFQKFHSAEEARALVEATIGPVLRFTHTSTSWQTTAIKTIAPPDTEIERALRRKFDLPWPMGQRVGLSEEAVVAWNNSRGRQP